MDIDVAWAFAVDQADIFDEDVGSVLNIKLKTPYEGETYADNLMIPVMYLRGPKEEIRAEAHKLIDEMIDAVGWE